MIVNKGRKKLFEVEVAGNVIFKILGLMFRKKIPRSGGMMFNFMFEGRWSMWMFGMRFPLDFIFIDKNSKIVDIRSNVKPLSLETATWKVIKPANKCKYVLEVNAGEAKRKGVKIGDVLSFD